MLTNVHHEGHNVHEGRPFFVPSAQLHQPGFVRKYSRAAYHESNLFMRILRTTLEGNGPLACGPGM